MAHQNRDSAHYCRQRSMSARPIFTPTLRVSSRPLEQRPKPAFSLSLAAANTRRLCGAKHRMLELDPPLMAASSQSSGRCCAKSAAIDSGDIALATPLEKIIKLP